MSEQVFSDSEREKAWEMARELKATSPESRSAPESRVAEVGDSLESAVCAALEALEQAGISAKDAHEFIEECVFNAWMGWDYGTDEDGNPLPGARDEEDE